MRNKFISDYIFNVTGKRRTPKQVGSRLQQLRDTAEGKRSTCISPYRSHNAICCSRVVAPSPPAVVEQASRYDAAQVCTGSVKLGYLVRTALYRLQHTIDSRAFGNALDIHSGLDPFPHSPRTRELRLHRCHPGPRRAPSSPPPSYHRRDVLGNSHRDPVDARELCSLSHVFSVRHGSRLEHLWAPCPAPHRPLGNVHVSYAARGVFDFQGFEGPHGPHPLGAHRARDPLE